MTSLDYLDLCRLCLVKDRVSVPIFDGEGDVRQIFLKIAACLPVKVARDDKLPKKICDDCVYKVELFYQFWNTTANAEKQLLQWLGDVGLEEKQGYASGVLNSDIMKQEQSESRLDVSVMQPTSGHSNNMAINMMDEMNLGIPMIMPTHQQITVPISSSNNAVQTIQSGPGPSTSSTHNQMARKGGGHDAEQDTSEDDNTDDECDADEGLPVKEECEETAGGSRPIEPTTFVNVSLTCDEAGPSGLQQQKLAEMPEMGLQQTSEGDVKSGEAETFGGLSGMLRQILSPSPETTDGLYSGFYNIQPNIFTNYTSVLSQSVQHIAPMSSPYINTTQSPSLMSLDQTSALDHLEIHLESHPCLSCGLEFRNALKLNYHIRTNHPININDMRQRHDGNGNESIGSNQIKYTCTMCGKIFPNLNHLHMHETTHITNTSNHQMQHNNVMATSVSMMSTEQSNSDQTFSCDRCQASFRYRTLLERHKKMHMTNQDKPYGCSRCPMRFETRTLYNHHAKTHKTILGPPQPAIADVTNNINHSTISTLTASLTLEKPLAVESPVSYPCDSCTKQFLTIESLTSHKAVHRSRPLVCDVCGKGFTHRKYYVVHQRIHTGERPYLCAMCGKSFTQASTLTVHRRYHTGERPYTCTLCGKGFVTRTIMLNHMKKH